MNKKVFIIYVKGLDHRLHCTASVTAPCLLVSSVLSMIIVIGLTIAFLIGTAAKVQEVELIMESSLVKCK